MTEEIKELIEQIESLSRIAHSDAGRIKNAYLAPLCERIIRTIQALAAELSTHQESSFHPDWSLLKATQDSLREHMALCKEYQAKIAELEQKLGECYKSLGSVKSRLYIHAYQTRFDEEFGYELAGSCEDRLVEIKSIGDQQQETTHEKM